jgi:hypothetical protein
VLNARRGNWDAWLIGLILLGIKKCESFDRKTEDEHDA